MRFARGLALALLALGACYGPRTGAISYAPVGADSRALRRAFNADVDRVRVVMLVDPS